MLPRFFELGMSIRRSLARSLRAYLRFPLFWFHVTFGICSSQSWVHRLGSMSRGFSVLGKAWISLFKKKTQAIPHAAGLKTIDTVQIQDFSNCKICASHLRIPLKYKFGLRMSGSGPENFHL